MAPSRRYDRHQVAKIVIEALDMGLPVTATLQEVMGVSTQQATHMIRNARAEGLLGVDEHVPARATIHRSTKHQQQWLVCEYCKSIWPCQSYITNRGTDTDERPPRERGAGD